MSQSIRVILGYTLRAGETLASVAQRFAADAQTAREVTKGVVELPVTVDLASVTTAKAGITEADIAKRFPQATIDVSDSHGVRSFRVVTVDETFDVTLRGDRIYITTFDGFGGVDDLRDGAASALARAYEAYRAVRVARKL